MIEFAFLQKIQNKFLLFLLLPSLLFSSVEKDWEFAENLYKNALYDIAMKEFKKIAEAQKGTIWEKKALYMMGECLYEMKDYKEAEKLYKEAAQRAFGEEKAFILLKVADCLRKQTLQDEAISLYKDIAEKYPQTSYAEKSLYFLALTLREKGKWKEAIAFFEEIPKKYPFSPFLDSSIYEAGYTFYKIGDYRSAINYFSKVSAKSPLNKKASYYIALCFYNMGDFEKAEDAFFEVIEKDPSDPLCMDARFMIASTYIGRNDYKKAEEYFKDLLLMHPPNHIAEKASFWHAESFYMQKKYKDALNAYTDFLKKYPGSPHSLDAKKGMAFSLFKLEEYNKCISSLQEILEKEKERDLYLLLAQAFKKVNKLEDAAKALKEIEKFPQRDTLFYEALLEYGWIRCEQKNAEEALKIAERIQKECAEKKILQQAQSLKIEALCKAKRAKDAKNVLLSLEGKIEEEDFIKLSLHVADALFDASFYEDARAFYKRALLSKKRREREFARYCIGWSLFKEKKFEEAEKMLSSLLKEAEESDIIPKAKRLLADCYFNQRKYIAAYNVYNELFSLYPQWNKRDELLYQMGWCHYKMGEYKKASSEFERLLTLFPSSPLYAQTTYWIGWCHFQQREYDGARKYFEKVYEDYKKSEWGGYALYMIADIYYNLKDFRSAFNHYKKVAEEYKEIESLREDAKKKMVLCLKREGREEECVEIYKEWAKKATSPEEAASYYLEIASLYRELKNEELEKETLSFIAEKYKDTSIAEKALYKLCKILFDEGDYKKTLENVNRFLRDFPSSHLFPDLFLLHAISSYKIGEKDKAEKLLFSFLERFRERKDLLPLCNLYIAHVKKEKGEDALSLYEKIINEYPESEAADEARLCIAKEYFDKKDYEKALKYITPILSREKTTSTAASAQLLKGRCLEAKGKEEEAIVEYLKVGYFYKDFETEAQEARFSAARIMEKKGEKKKALHLYKIIKESAKDQETLRRVEECIERLSQ